MLHVTILFESNPKVDILVWIYLYILTSHLVLGLYLTLMLKILISDGHIDDNFFREKFVSQPGLEPQISRFPYWHLNHLGHCDTLTDQETNLSLIQVSIQDFRECNMLLFFLRATHKWVFLVWIYLYINQSPSVRSVFDINIENFYIRWSYR